MPVEEGDVGSFPTLLGQSQANGDKGPRHEKQSQDQPLTTS